VRTLRRAPGGQRLIAVADGVRLRLDPFAVFLYDEGRQLDAARQDHLATLDLELAGASVLEVGAGIGLHTPFLTGLGCEVVSTDGRPGNVRELARRNPDVRVGVLDLESAPHIDGLGHFDVVYCYGLLYHLSRPEQALRSLSEIADTILLETCVTPGDSVAVNLVAERAAVATQATGGTGCRPTRPWIMQTLQALWGNAYVSTTQPVHPWFPLDWSTLPTTVEPSRFTRAVFVGSRRPLDTPTLLTVLPDRQNHVAVT